MLRQAITASPRDAGLHYALGLTLVRQKRLEEALGELLQAAMENPGQARYGYVYAVALHSAGRASEAMTAKEGLAHRPHDRDTLSAIISFSRDAGDFGTALETPNGWRGWNQATGTWLTSSGSCGVKRQSRMDDDDTQAIAHEEGGNR